MSPSFPASSSKTRMNSSPIRRRFSSGSSIPSSRARNRSCRLDVDERHVEVAAERLGHLLGLVRAHEAVVDEDAGELVADGLVDEQRGDRRVDAAGEAADDAVATDLRTDPLHLLLDHGGRRPGRGRAGDVVEEVLQQVLAVRRVHDLGVELDAVELPLRILERCDRRRRGRPRHDSAFRRRDDRVAVAHPDDLLLGQPCEERARTAVELGLAEFGRTRARDLAAQLERQQLRAVTDPERRDPEVEDRLVDSRRALGVDRGRASGEDQRGGVPPPHVLGAERVRHQLGIDAGVADTARDQLCVLAAEVEHEHRPLLRSRLGERERVHRGHQGRR